MKQGYLILASERRVLNVMISDELVAILQVLGYTTSGHGTTFHTEDQLLVSGGKLDRATSDLFWVAGGPFSLSRYVW